MCFAIFPLHLSKLRRLPQKSDARSYEVLHLSRKIISANLKIWCSKMQPLSGNQRPDLLTSLMNMSLVQRLPRKMHLCRSSLNVPRLPSFLEMLQNPHILLTFEKVHNPLRLPRETTSERPKVLRTRQFFALLTSKCASRHNGVHFFDIATSKSGFNMWCFVHFDFEMCFAPQRRALFRHRNSEKWSEHVVFCTFWLRNLLRATTACTFSTSQLPKVGSTCGVLYILTSKCASRHSGVHFFDIATPKSGPNMWCFVHFDFEICFVPQRRALFPHRNFQACGVLYILTWKFASRHNGVQFFISHVASWLRTCRFSEPTFRPSTFLPFRAPASSFFLLFLFSDLLSSTLPFCFSFVHIVGSLTSKLPSIISSICLSAYSLIILAFMFIITINNIFIYIYIFVFIYSYDFSFYLNSSSQVHISPCARRRWVVACWCSLKGKRWGQTDSFGDPAINTLMDYSLVNYITWLWTTTIFNREIIYQWSFSIAMLNYQRYMGVS